MNGTTQTRLDDVEEKLKAIWLDVLQRSDVGIDDNFFEVGGHSLKALELEVRIGVEFDSEISLETSSTISPSGSWRHISAVRRTTRFLS